MGLAHGRAKHCHIFTTGMGMYGALTLFCVNGTFGDKTILQATSKTVQLKTLKS